LAAQPLPVSYQPNLLELAQQGNVAITALMNRFSNLKALLLPLRMVASKSWNLLKCGAASASGIATKV